MLSWLRKQRARRRLRRTLGIWYHPGYKADCLGKTARVPHLDLERGQRVLDRLSAEGLVRAGDIQAAQPISLAELTSVHSASYVEETTQPLRLAHIFGLEADLINVDCVLMAQRFAVGATVAAARWATKQPGRVGFNLGGGFHHAEPEGGAGFCVYNDIAVAIALLRRAGWHNNVAIVDLDFHQGNGNIVAFAEDPSVLTFSIHSSAWTHVEAVADHQILLPSGADDALYLRALRRALPKALQSHQPSVVFYVAGNDVLRFDALGNFSLTPSGVLQRDRYVIETTRELGASVVATLGGGYSRAAWQVTASFLRWLLTDRVDASISSDGRPLRSRFAGVARSLDPFELQGEDGDWSLNTAEIEAELMGRQPTRRILDYYSVSGVEMALERYGLLDKIRAKGFSDLRVSVDPSDSVRQRLTVHGQKGTGQHHLLVDLVIRRVSAQSPMALELISVEWLQLQDPTSSFTLRRPPMPGQKHPGLGMVRDVMELLYQACRRLHIDGIVVHPSHYHVAAVAAGHCQFLDPAIQGWFDAVRTSISPYDVAEASSLIEEGRVRDRDGAVVRWKATDFVVPVSPRLVEFFASESYRRTRAAALQATTLAEINIAGSARDLGASVFRDDVRTTPQP